MFVKVVALCSVVACVLAAPSPTGVVPLEKQQPTVIPIISQSEELENNGTYKFSYETANGIKREEISYNKIVPKVEGRSAGSNEASGSGSEESEEIHVQQGSYSYTAPDGTVITVRYIADENGFRVFGDHLPKAPALFQQLQAKSSQKSGKALDAENAESAPAAVAAEPVVAPAPVASKPEEAPKELETRSGSDAEEKSAPTTETAQKLANQDSPTTVSAPSTTSASATEAASTSASEQSTTQAASTTSAEAVTTNASTQVAEQSTTRAASTASAESSATEAASTPSATEASEAASTAAPEAATTPAQSGSEVSTTSSPTTSA